MATSLVIESDDGFLPVKLPQPVGEAVTVHLDLFEAVNGYAAIHAEHADMVERGAAWVAWLRDRGFPPISHGAAFKIAATVNEAVKEYQKKTPGLVSESVASPGSSESDSPTSSE